MPNDPLFGDQWGLRNNGQPNENGYSGLPDADIDATDAWAAGLPSGKTTVAVLDTGVLYTHEDLYLNIWLNQGEIPVDLFADLIDIDEDGLITFWDLNDPANSECVFDHNATGYIDAGDLLADPGWANGIDEDGDSLTDDLIGWDFLDNDNDPNDADGHGGRVASIIAGVTNNGIGIAGLAYNRVLIMAVRFETTAGVYDVDDAVAAVNYVAASGVKISCNSWGVPDFQQPLYDAICVAGEGGHLFVSAAGNQTMDLDQEFNRYPAEFDLGNIISVAATSNTDELATFANWGALSVDLSAPGASIMKINPGDSYGWGNGSSYATPLVAGTAALLHLQNPAWSAAEIKSRIMETVDVIPPLVEKTVTGGRLNVAKALGVAPLLAVKKGSPSGEVFGSVSQLRITFAHPVDAVSLTSTDVVIDGPAGPIELASITAVPGTGDREFDFQIPDQTNVGIYTYSIGPNVLDLLGRALDQDGDGVWGEIGDDQYCDFFFLLSPTSHYTNSTPLVLRDKKKMTSTILVSDVYSIVDLEVTLNISHTNDADLDVFLISPSGTRVELFTDVGGSGDNFTNTTLDAQAEVAITSGVAPFNGTYRPEGSLSAFNGQSVTGTWTLEITDDAAKNSGTLQNWALTVTR
ncbi:MAG: S8 family serine peptidase [Pirellulaceae bacterium]